MKELIFRILGLDAETQKRAIVSIITYVVDGLYLFGGITIPDAKVDYIIKGALALITALVWIHGFYMNENYTEAGCEGTGYTRAIKADELEPVQETYEDDDYREMIDEDANYEEELEEPVYVIELDEDEMPTEITME